MSLDYKGDFNIVLSNFEKIGRRRVDKNAIREFNDWIQDLDLASIPRVQIHLVK